MLKKVNLDKYEEMNAREREAEELAEAEDDELEVKLEELHEGQKRIMEEGKRYRFNAVCCGRRFGKTALLIHLAVTYSCSEFRIPTRQEKTIPGLVGVFTPTYKQGQEIWTALELALKPIIQWKSKSERRIQLITGGTIDLWQLQGNTLAGRGRKYHLALIDEAAFTRQPVMLDEIYPRAIRPTLMDYEGECWVFSTPNGMDEENFFYAICHNPKWSFKVHCAPTSSNPMVPPREIEEYRRTMSPRDFEQEIEAKFTDKSGEAFFDINKLLVETGEINRLNEKICVPDEPPKTCDFVFVVCDTGIKGGSKHDGHGFLYVAVKRSGLKEPKMWILDWELLSVTGAFFERELPRVLDRGLQLAKQCGAMGGFVGIHMERKGLGELLVMKSEKDVFHVKGHEGKEYSKIIGIDTAITQEGKEGRAQLVSTYHYQGFAKITRYAYEKTTEFKKVSANHLIRQLKNFVLGDPLAHKRADDLLDCYCYALSLCFGDAKIG